MTRLPNLPPEEADAQRHRDAPLLAAQGKRVRFEDDRPWWWSVRATSGGPEPTYVVLTRQRQFQPVGELFYCIVDFGRGLRGPCNQIGQGWGDGTFTDEECQALVAALVAGEREVSYRNHVRIRIADTGGPLHHFYGPPS